MSEHFTKSEKTKYKLANAVKEIPGEVNVRGFKKALVCSDPDLIKFGVTQKVIDVLEEASLAYEVYSNINPNPTIENVQTGVEAFKKSGADYMIAIGGGSFMDTAKAIGIIITNPEFEDVRSLEGVAPTKNPCVPIIAVPTTAGTAAEVGLGIVHSMAHSLGAVYDTPHGVGNAILLPTVMEYNAPNSGFILSSVQRMVQQHSSCTSLPAASVFLHNSHSWVQSAPEMASI